MKKKVLSIILALLMVAALLPMGALADTGTYQVVGGASFDYIGDAIDACPAGGTIKMLKNDMYASGATLSFKTFTFDLAGCTMQGEGSTLFEGYSNSITIADSIGGGKMIGPAVCIWFGGENNVINVTGGTLKDTSGLGVIICEDAPGAVINVTGGTLEGADTPNTASFGGFGYPLRCACIEANEEATISYVEGSLVTKYPGAKAVEAAEGSDISVTEPVVPEEPAVAKIGEVGYPTLEAAVADANGKTIVMQDDYNITNTLAISDKTFTLDLNGYTVSVKSSKWFELLDNADLTIMDSSENETGMLIGNVGVCLDGDNSTLTLKSGTIADRGSSIAPIYVEGTNNVINVEGGCVKNAGDGTRSVAFHCHDATDTTVNVTGGVFETAYALIADQEVGAAEVVVSGGVFKFNVPETYLDPTVETQDNGDGTFSVVAADPLKVAKLAAKAALASYVNGLDLTAEQKAAAIAAGEALIDAATSTELLDAALEQAKADALAEVPTVAKIGDVEYKDLAEAATALKDGDTLTLMADCTGKIDVIGKAITLDLNGKTLTGLWGESALNLGGNASLTIVGDGMVEADVCVFMTGAGNKLYLNGGTLKDTSTAGVVVFDQTTDNYIEVNGATLINGVDESLVVTSPLLSHVFSDYGGENWNLVINFKSGVVESGDFDAFYFTNTEADVEISGGSFSKAAPAEYLAKGIEATVDEEGNIVYTETLSAAQEKALAELEGLTYSSDEAKAIIETAKAAVEAASSRTEVEAIVDQAKTDAAAADALAEAKAAAIAELYADNAKQMTAEVKGIIEDAVAAINALSAAEGKTAADVNSIVADANGKIEAALAAVNTCYYKNYIARPQAGTFKLELGGKYAGEYTFVNTGDGWNIMTADGKYVVFDGSKVTTDTEAYTWKYDGGLFTTVTTTTPGSSSDNFFTRIFNAILRLFGLGGNDQPTTTTTNYYLAFDGSNLTASTSKVAAAFYTVETAEEHVLGDWYSNGDGTHSRDCSRCGETVTMYCSFVEGKCEVCGAVKGDDPDVPPVEPDDPPVTDLGITVTWTPNYDGWWIFKVIENYTCTVTVTNGTILTPLGGTFRSELPSDFNITALDANGRPHFYQYNALLGIVTEVF